MQNDNLQLNPNSTGNGEISNAQPSPATSGQKVIQPLSLPQVSAQDQELQPTPVIIGSTQSPPAYGSSAPATNSQMPVMSASQMGLSQAGHKFFDTSAKNLLIKGLVLLVVLGGVFAALIFTNVIALNRFKTVSYTNSKGTHYSFLFYTKHTAKTLKSGNTQLVSKVAVDGKFPLALSIDSSDSSGYTRLKDCSGFTKLFDIQNDYVNQKVSVCNFTLGQNTSVGVYVAGILVNNQASVVTITQDLSGINLSSQSAAQEALTKFDLSPYQNDIKKIIASIKVE